MVLLPSWSAVFLVLFGFHNPEDAILHRSSTLKKFDSEHLRIFHTGEYQESARLLAKDGDAFLKRIEKEWGIVLPDQMFTVSLIRVHPATSWVNHDFDPPWLYSSYDPISKRIELRANPAKFQFHPVLKALKHQLIHALLNIESAQPLPPFLEEGIARHYAGSRGSRQVYWAILGFQRAKEIEPFLKNPFTYQIDLDFQYAGAMGYLFVSWLWQRQPGSEKNFLQQHLRGNDVDGALAAAGLPGLGILLPLFEAEIRPQYGLKRILKTYDFWLLFLSIVAIIAILFKVISAVRMARMGFEEIVPAPESVPAELFQGPAFQPPSEAPEPEQPSVLETPPVPDYFTPSQPKKRPSPPKTDEVSIPPMQPIVFQEASVLDRGGITLDTDDFDQLDDQLNEVFDRMSNTVEPPPKSDWQTPMSQPRKKKAKPIGEDTKAGIEAALDHFFDKLPSEDGEG